MIAGCRRSARLSLGAAVLFGVATVCRRRRGVGTAPGRRPPRGRSGLLRLVTDRWYVAGSALDLVGCRRRGGRAAAPAAVHRRVLHRRLDRRDGRPRGAGARHPAAPRARSRARGRRCRPGAAGGQLVAERPVRPVPRPPWVLLAGVAVIAVVAWRALLPTSSPRDGARPAGWRSAAWAWPSAPWPCPTRGGTSSPTRPVRPARLRRGRRHGVRLGHRPRAR